MEMPDYTLLDEVSMPLHTITQALTALAGRVEDAGGVCAWDVSALHLEMPVELDVCVLENGAVVLGSNSSHVSLESSFPSTLHTLRLTLVQEDECYTSE